MASPLATTDEVLSPRALAVEREVLDPAGTLGAAALASPAASGGADPDSRLVEAVTDQLMTQLAVASGDESAATLRRGLVDTLRRASVATGDQTTSDPIAGTATSGGLARALRAALGSPSSELLRDDEVDRLAAAVPLVLDDLAGGRFPARAVCDLIADPALLPPPGLDERTESARAEDEAEAVSFEAGDPAADPGAEGSGPGGGVGGAPLIPPGAAVLLATGPQPPSGLQPFINLAKLLSRDMADFLRLLRKVTIPLVTSTHLRSEGDVAHQLIQGHYLLEHPYDEVLVDDNVRIGKKAFTKLKDSTSPEWARVRDGLSVAGFVGAPDILNLTTQEVYEIKPLDQMLDGAVQLWLRYLLPLNAAGAIAAGQVKAAAVAFLNTIASNGAPLSTPGWKPWLPGIEFTPAPAYVVPGTGQVFMAARIAPGLIVYQYERTQEQTAEALATMPVASAKKSDEYKEHYLVAALLAGCALRARRQASGGQNPVDAAVALGAALDALPRPVDLESGGVTPGQILVILGLLLAGIVLAKVVGGAVLAQGSVALLGRLVLAASAL